MTPIVGESIVTTYSTCRPFTFDPLKLNPESTYSTEMPWSGPWSNTALLAATSNVSKIVPLANVPLILADKGPWLYWFRNPFGPPL